MTKTPECRFCYAAPSLQSIKGNFVYGGRGDQHFWKCRSCEMIYLDPPMSEEDEARFYNSEFEKYMEKRSGADTDWSGPEKHFLANQREVKRRMPFLEPYIGKPFDCAPRIPPSGRGRGSAQGKVALEIGCSSGFMLSALKERGMKVFGIDPSGGFVEYVKAKGIPVYKTLEEFKKEFNSPVDLLIHYYVLEHVRFPVEFVKEYMKLINDGGAMVFEVPCASDPLVELYKIPAFDQFYWSIAHHWYFTKESLSSECNISRFFSLILID